MKQNDSLFVRKILIYRELIVLLKLTSQGDMATCIKCNKKNFISLCSCNLQAPDRITLYTSHKCMCYYTIILKIWHMCQRHGKEIINVLSNFRLVTFVDQIQNLKEVLMKQTLRDTTLKVAWSSKCVPVVCDSFNHRSRDELYFLIRIADCHKFHLHVCDAKS